MEVDQARSAMVISPPSTVSGVGTFLSIAAYAAIAFSFLGAFYYYDNEGSLALAIVIGLIGTIQGSMLLAFASMTTNLARIDWMLSSAAIPAAVMADDRMMDHLHSDSINSGAF